MKNVAEVVERIQARDSKPDCRVDFADNRRNGRKHQQAGRQEVIHSAWNNYVIEEEECSLLFAAVDIRITESDESLGRSEQEVLKPEDAVQKGLHLALTPHERLMSGKFHTLGAAVEAS